MALRRTIVTAATAALLGACSSATATAPEVSATAEAADGADVIACALAGQSDFAQACAVERDPAEDALYLTVRHPDGGFRRFKVLEDGRGLEPADGAQKARLRMNGDWLELEIGRDRYRFPATRMDNAATP